MGKKKNQLKKVYSLDELNGNVALLSKICLKSEKALTYYAMTKIMNGNLASLNYSTLLKLEAAFGIKIAECTNKSTWWAWRKLTTLKAAQACGISEG